MVISANNNFTVAGGGAGGERGANAVLGQAPNGPDGLGANTSSGFAEAPGGLPSLRVDGVIVIEGDTGTVAAVFTVSLSATSADSVTASFTTADATAIAGIDYLNSSGTVMFPPNTATQTISIDVTADRVGEKDETFLVVLSSPNGATLEDPLGVAIVRDPDADNDAMPDDFEFTHQLNPNDPADATLDSYGDGVINRDEFAAGTDPRNPSSVFRITRVQKTGSDVGISFSSTLGKDYYVERKDDLSVVGWTTAIDEMEGTGMVVDVTDPGGGAAVQRFYRAVVLP